MTRTAVDMEVGIDGVAVITMFHPPVNSLDDNVIQGVRACLKEAYGRSDVRAIVLTGANNKFSGGADINNFQKNKADGDESDDSFDQVQFMNDEFEGGPKPIVAAIEGFALGGGLEFAMSCHARIAVPGAKLGLPELHLGIIPGLGGTQRLPRLVGVANAIDMMLTGRLISSEKALQLGLVDAVVQSANLLAEAHQWALNISLGQRKWQRSLTRIDHLGSAEESLNIIKQARGRIDTMFKNVPHPSACLDAVEQGLVKNPIAGTVLERKLSRDLVKTPTAQGLIHAFFCERVVTKVPGITDQGLTPRKILSVGVVGGGMMGSGIVTAIVLERIPVILKEVDAKALQNGINLVKANLKNRAARGGLSEENLQKTLDLVKGTLDYRDFQDVDLVVEAVFESMQLKQTVFEDLEKYCKPDCILATNTSLLDIGKIGAKTRSRDRIIGAHFFSPAQVMPLLEIIRTEQTSTQVLVDLIDFGKILKKIPIVVRSSVGFAVNRVFYPYGMVAAFLATEVGIHPYRIDAIAKKFGMPMGPFRMNDMTGNLLAQSVWKYWCESFPSSTYRGVEGLKLIDILISSDRLGEKTGKGYYNYTPGSRAPELEGILAQARKAARNISNVKEVSLSDDEILEMLLFPVVNEACRVLDEGSVVRAADLDMATILGMGFPRYRGGIVFWGDQIGAKYIHTQLSKWASLYESPLLADFFKPCASLTRAVQQNIPLAQIMEEPKSRL